MKIKILTIILSISFLSSCVMVRNKMEELKPIAEYSTDSIIIEDKNALDAEILFMNGQHVKTKIKAAKNPFYKKIVETSVIKYIPIYDNQGKSIYISYELIKQMTITDFVGEQRIFVNRGSQFKSLQEILYDGKIKWYRYFFTNAYNRSLQYDDIFVDENGQEASTGLFTSLKSVLIKTTIAKPEFKDKIDHAEKLDITKVREILKEFEQ